MRRARASRAAFTLVEVLMAVAIAAALFAATAMAIAATTRAYAGNAAAANMLQHGRNAAMRIAAEMRAGTAHLPATAAKQTLFTAGSTVSDTGVLFIDDSGRLLAYRYNAAQKLVTLSVSNATPATVARGVEAFTVRMVPARSQASIRTGGAHDQLMRATVTLTLQPSDPDASSGTLTLTQSVTPRSRLID